MTRLARRLSRLLRLAMVPLLALWLLAPALALAGPRSGGSFSGRGGFRSSGGSSSFSRIPSRPSYGDYGYSRGPNVIVTPGWGWGFMPFFGGGGHFSLIGTLVLVGVVWFGISLFRRAVSSRQWGRAGGGGGYGAYDAEDDEPAVAAGRAYVYKVQLALGRSARGIQQRLESFAAEGDTGSEAGLALLLQQTTLELMREKDVIRYGSVSGDGPLNMTGGETKLNALSLAERSRFQVERVRGADGKVLRSSAAATTSDDVLEYLVVTIIVATRATLPGLTAIKKGLSSREELDAILADLGGVSPDVMLGLEVIWTPADPDDALTESEMLTSYPDLRAL